MARADDDRDRGGAEPGHGIHAGTSDARLTELLRADTVTAYPALQELRARHHPHVLAYARLCTPHESMARQLAAQAFTLAARQTARGIDSGLPWRHQLLLLVARSAGSWAGDGRAAGLDAGLLLVLNSVGPSGPVPPMLTAFQSLSSRTQGLIWYGIVEREPAEDTAALLGLTREDVTYGTGAALQQLARASLRTRLTASEDPDCPDFGRLIEEAVRPDSPRDSADLHAHMTHCPHCTTAYEELAALRDAPSTALAEGLLPWGGTAYVAGDPGERAVGGTGAWRSGPGPAGSGREPEDGERAPDRRRTVLVSAVLGVALLPVAVFLAARGGSPSPDPVGSANTQVSTPPVVVTVTATVPETPSSASASPSPSPSRTSKSPSPTTSPSPTKTASPKPPPSSTRPISGSFAQVVNVASSLCLDVSGAFSNGTDVITAPCSSSRAQRWRVDDDRGLLQSAADPDFCLDSRGATHRGVGIWECDSVEGRNGRNLMFVVDEDGLIRPAIAFGTAVTPDGGAGNGLSLEPAGEGHGQRWRAGAA
ncbi:RICIN domain-containing protein [Streptomyces sp. Z38]|uniref:RICIN domain-containing protein n=1 Tax=Streptomyces sp. Z38 TaxID=2682780 RepID=UPI0012E9E4FA|nr:RICIN domain-containing protein [Streptomyces sp. Z38]MUT88106.1 ricin-type beta-trefoil lectin domain protein [Streptomyces sp. Z38]